MILSEAISLAKEKLSKTYSNSNELNAVILMLFEHYFGISRTNYYTSRERRLSESNLEPFLQALEKLQEHCPIQYVIGKAAFYGLSFKVNENVLIPRPETEELVDWIYKDCQESSNIRILDIGTGSGAIAVSLASLLPSAHIKAIDISPSALKLAQENAEANNVSVHFIEEDIFSPSSALTGQIFDIIVSNPPYVRESEKEYMDPNVLSYEPQLALFVPDSNPLLYYKAIAHFAENSLASNGYIYLETNEYLANETALLFPNESYTSQLRKDMNGKSRMLKISKR